MKSNYELDIKTIIITKREQLNIILLLLRRILASVANMVRVREDRSSIETRFDAHSYEEICQDLQDYLNRNHQNKTSSI